VVVEVTGGRNLENGLVIPGTFKAITRSRRLGAKFHEEVTNVKRLCIHMDISLEKKGKKTGATLKECYVIFIKSAVYVYRTTCSAVI